MTRTEDEEADDELRARPWQSRRPWLRGSWPHPAYYGGLGPYYGGLGPYYGGLPPLPHGYSTSDACLRHGESRQVLFLSENCKGFPTGPICCPQQQDVVYCQGNVGGGHSVGTLHCMEKDAWL